MRLEKYKDFEVEDLALDPEFKVSILQPESRKTDLYTALLERFPERQVDLSDARQLVFHLERQYQSQHPSAEDKQEVYQNIVQLRQERKNQKGKNTWRLNGWLAIAASFLLIIAGAAWFFVGGIWQETGLYRTTYAEVADYTLPDGTLVRLNANSSLELVGDWQEAEQREVRLQGEAYFKVAKQEATKAKFIVHTNGPDIEVLGTQFNVNTRAGRTLVMLEEGKIKLISQSSVQGPKIMKERQLADYQAQRKLIRSDIDPAKYTLWMQGYFSVDELSFGEVIEEIERVYGVKVQLEIAVSQEMSVAKGALPIQDLDELILTFETLYNVAITQEDETLRIR